MLYSKSWQYGIRILLALAQGQDERRVAASALARRAGVPPAFASKILGRLAAAKVVSSRRGPGGGVTLARKAAQIRIREVVAALGEEDAIGACILGFRECSDATPCPLHPIWGPMRESLRGSLLDRSLEDFRLLPAPSAARPARRR